MDGTGSGQDQYKVQKVQKVREKRVWKFGRVGRVEGTAEGKRRLIVHGKDKRGGKQGGPEGIEKGEDTRK